MIERIADNICETYGLTTNEQRADVLEQLQALKWHRPAITDTQRALAVALLTVEAEFADRCAKCTAQNVGPVSADQWNERAEAYRAAIELITTQHGDSQ